jgi:hypothetical protein
VLVAYGGPGPRLRSVERACAGWSRDPGDPVKLVPKPAGGDIQHGEFVAELADILRIIH